MSEDVKVTLVLSSWSTGSTSVAGFLDKAGAYTCPPHLHTVDDLTPNAYEPLEYQEALAKCVDNMTLQQKGRIEDFVAFFVPWLDRQKALARQAGSSCIVIKQPLQATLLPILNSLVDCRYVVVTRPYDDVENTRIRRNWHPVRGQLGATAIYGMIHDYLQSDSKSYLTIAYKNFLKDPSTRDMLLAYVGLTPTTEQRAEADGWLRR